VLEEKIANLEAQLVLNAEPSSDNHRIAALEEQVFKYPYTHSRTLTLAHSHFQMNYSSELMRANVRRSALTPRA